jgi:hypothetical protein
MLFTLVYCHIRSLLYPKDELQFDDNNTSFSTAANIFSPQKILLVDDIVMKMRRRYRNSAKTINIHNVLSNTKERITA